MRKILVPITLREQLATRSNLTKKEAMAPPKNDTTVVPKNKMQQDLEILTKYIIQVLYFLEIKQTQEVKNKKTIRMVVTKPLRP